jgi:hypothetical protein
MSHTLHRKGDPENLKKDFVVFCMSAKTVNGAGSAGKKKRFFEILEKYPHVNFGDVKTGSRLNSDWDTVHDSFKDQSVPHYVFTDPKVVGEVLTELKAADLGMSVVVSGVMESVEELCRAVGLEMHTVEYSGGILGKTERLPEGAVLEITTMCGHALVSGNLVPEMLRQIRKGKKTLEEAAAELGRQCMCGVFNPRRAEQVLKALL